MTELIIDRFGGTIRTTSLDDNHFQVKVKVCVGPTFYRWVFGFGGQIIITGPDAIIEKYREMLAGSLKQYEQ